MYKTGEEMLFIVIHHLIVIKCQVNFCACKCTEKYKSVLINETNDVQKHPPSLPNYLMLPPKYLKYNKIKKSSYSRQE